MAATATPTISPARSICFEALDAVRKHLPHRREPHRSCAASRWAARRAGTSRSTMPVRWAAAAPGAGFSETPDFLRIFQQEDAAADLVRREALAPVRLHRLGDQPLPTARRSPTAAKGSAEAGGRRDGRALDAEGMHAGRTSSAPAPAQLPPRRPRRRSTAASTASPRKGRDLLPRHVRFTTWTLRYNRMHWVTVDGLEQHWERARVDAEHVGAADGARSTTQNVTALTLAMPPGHLSARRNAPAAGHPRRQGARPAAPVLSDRSWDSHFRKADGGLDWSPASDDGDAAQAARLARPDRRRVHGPLPHGPADRQADQREGRQMGRRRDGPCHRRTGGSSSAAKRSVKDDTDVTRSGHRRAATWSCGAIRAATRCWRRSPTSCRSAGTARASRVGEQDVRRRTSTCRC